jgi:hypothetical protein
MRTAVCSHMERFLVCLVGSQSGGTTHCTWVNGVQACGTIAASAVVLDPFISFGEGNQADTYFLIDDFRLWSTFQSTSMPNTGYTTNVYPPADFHLDFTNSGINYYDRSGNNRNFIDVSSLFAGSLSSSMPVVRSTITAPFIHAKLGVTVVFSSGTMTLNPGSIAMTSGTPAVVPLGVGGSTNLFTVTSSIYGATGIQINRAFQDVTNIAVRCNDLVGLTNYPVSISYISNQRTFSATVYQEMDLCSIALTYTSSTPTFTYALTGISGLAASASTVYSPNLFPLVVGTNVIEIYSAADGPYTITLFRSAFLEYGAFIKATDTSAQTTPLINAVPGLWPNKAVSSSYAAVIPDNNCQWDTYTAVGAAVAVARWILLHHSLTRSLSLVLGPQVRIASRLLRAP